MSCRVVSCRVVFVSCRVVSCRGVQKIRQGDWHISVTSSQLKLKALGHFKTLVHLPLSQTNSGTTQNTLLFREKCAFTLHRTENKSLFFRSLYILHRFAVTDGGGRDYELPNAHCTSFLLDSRPVKFASLCGLQFLLNY